MVWATKSMAGAAKSKVLVICMVLNCFNCFLLFDYLSPTPFLTRSANAGGERAIDV